MTQKDSRQEEEIREVLVNAIEVELAALKAAVRFWKEWMEQTSEYVKATSETLKTIRSADKDTSQVLLEVVDKGRESIRTMTELPRNAAAHFIHELDSLQEKKKKTGAKKATRKKKKTKSKKTTPAAKAKRVTQRRARVKN